MTPSQKRARMRNWTKALILAMRTNASIIAKEYPITKSEHPLLEDIQTTASRLLSYWDKNYEIIKEEYPI